MTRVGSSPIFVGRRGELDRLDRALERAALGAPSLVLVAGDAGVGKSRLITEYVDHAEAAGAIAAVGGCLDIGEGGLPYAPFAEAFRALAHPTDPAAIGSASTATAEGLGAFLPDLREPGIGVLGARDSADRLARLFDAVIGALGRLSADQPAVLVLEDLHWSDGSTRDLLRFLVRNLRDERLVIVATYRSDDLHRRHPLRPLLAELDRADRVERIELKPFGRDEVAQQLAGILGETPRPALVDGLLDRSDGLPFYVEELVIGDARGGADLPPTLRDILGLRLATLSSSARTLVRTAAVIGGRFSHERIASMSDADERGVVAALDEAVEARILVPTDAHHGPGYRFRHALLREAAYDEILPAERIGLHLRLANELETEISTGAARDPSVIADYALHVYLALDQPRALAASIRAVDALVAASAYREALGHAQRALELWPRVDDARDRARIDHADLLEQAAYLASAVNEQAAATAFMQAALLELPPVGARERRVVLLAALYEIAWEAEDFEISASAAEEAYALMAPTGASPAKALAYLTLGWQRWWEGRLRESLVLCDDAAAMSLDLGDRSGWTNAVSAAAHTLADLGWAVRASEYVDRSAEHDATGHDRLESIMAYFDRSIALWTAGRFADAARAASEGLGRATRYGWDTRFGSGFRACLADAYLELGRYDDVDALTRPGIEGDGITHTITWAALTMVQADVAQGRLDHAHRLMDHIQPDPSMDLAALEMSAVELARAEGRFDDVVARIERLIADRPTDERVIPYPMLFSAGTGAAADLAVLARRRRRPADVAAATVHAERWMDRFHDIVAIARSEGGAGPFIDAHLATAEAEMARLSGTSDPHVWSVAVDRWSELEQPHKGAYARLRLAEALLDAGDDRERAGAVLIAAAETASILRARPLESEIRQIAQRARIDLPGSDGPTDEGSGLGTTPPILTARELEVMRLVSEGHTNREIGERLFISEKTVSVHVSNAMAKLGALSRYEAAASAQGLGLL